jgi:hypothetical protein
MTITLLFFKHAFTEVFGISFVSFTMVKDRREMTSERIMKWKGRCGVTLKLVDRAYENFSPACVSTECAHLSRGQSGPVVFLTLYL